MIVDNQLTNNVLFRTQVKRVVVTSSCAAVMDPPPKPTIFSENDWNVTSPKQVEEQGSNAAPLTVYRASKTLAEKGTNS
jgi:nucleoside-diphosphate-sugar epimerase